jgi:hypothetical protein
MSQSECSQCGNDALIWLDGSDPRCGSCPREECKRCGADLDNSPDEDSWEWDDHCDECAEIVDMGIWCENCHEAPTLEKWGYEGVKISCGCCSCTVPHEAFSLRAPIPWQVDGRHGERRMRK